MAHSLYGIVLGNKINRGTEEKKKRLFWSTLQTRWAETARFSWESRIPLVAGDQPPGHGA